VYTHKILIYGAEVPRRFVNRSSCQTVAAILLINRPATLTVNWNSQVPNIDNDIRFDATIPRRNQCTGFWYCLRWDIL